MARYKINKTFEVARVGEWNGTKITPEMLQEVERNNKSAKSPIIRGHVNYPAGSEAEGYIENPRVNGDRLLFDAVLYDDLAKDFESEKFINHSVEIKPYTSIGAFVPALALLGAEAPGMKGLQVFNEKEETILHFNEKINQEVNMDFEKELSLVKTELEKGYNEKLEAEKLSFAEYKENAEKKLKEANEKIAELTGKIDEQKKATFAEMADQKVKELPEADQKAKKEKLMKFSEKCETVEEFKEYLSEVNYKSTKVELPADEPLKFSEESEINEFNSPAR